MISNINLSTVCGVFLGVITPTLSQTELAIPGSPKGELTIELLQSRTYCRAIERTLQTVPVKFPELKMAALAANASWESSPFAIGCDSIEDNIIKDGGNEGRAMLGKLDEDTWNLAAEHVELKSIVEAREFLRLVDQRAKGGIEADMVRGNLLWNYKPFQEHPEKEIERGYVEKFTHTGSTNQKIFFEVPMSWRPEKSAKKELMSFRNCYGHGNIWMTVFVSPSVDGFEQAISAEEMFDLYSEESLRAEYLTLGIKLKSFTKTKVNGMLALMFSREQPFEQLGVKATRDAKVIRAFTGGEMISFQINTLGPEGGKTGAIRIKKNEQLFHLIGGSLRIE